MTSILFSLYMHFATLSLCDALSDTWAAFRGIVRALRSRSGDAQVVAALRTRICEKCEFYDAEWQTCGTPGETMGEELGVQIKVGCWCYLPLANRDPKKDCYARANELKNASGEDVGWPDAIRPSSKE